MYEQERWVLHRCLFMPRLRWFISKMFVYVPTLVINIKDVCLSLTGGRGRRRRSRGSRRSWTTGRTTATSTISPSDLDQCSWIENHNIQLSQLSHLLIPKLLLDLGRSEYRYSYINYLTFWYQTVQCIPISPSDISQCSVSQKFFTILNAMNTHAMNTSTSDLNQLRSSYKPGLPYTSFE